MPNMKLRVLPGVVIVFSGVLPLGTNIQTADISTWAKTFGARITDKVSREVTHVIAARAGTAKVKQAVKRGIKVVSTSWLISSIQRWRKLDERPFLLEGAGQKRNDSTSSDIEKDVGQEHLTTHDFMLSSSEEEGSDNGFGDTDADVDEHDFGGDLSTKQNGNADHNVAEAMETGDGSNDTIEEDGPPKKRLKLNTNTNGGTANANGDANPRITITGSTTDSEPEGEDGSPVTINQDDWDDMDAELKEFMGSEVDSESDNDSVSSKLSLREKKANTKRKRQDDDDGSLTVAGTTGGGGSALRKVRNVESQSETPPRSVSTSSSAIPVDDGTSLPLSATIPTSSPTLASSTSTKEHQPDTDTDPPQDTALDDPPTNAQFHAAAQRTSEPSQTKTTEAPEEEEEEDTDDELARELERELEEG